MSNDQVFANWSDSASFWDKHRAAHRAMFLPIIATLREEAEIPEPAASRPYQVLEVAAGVGDVSLELAATLGPNATIWCTDLVPDMVRNSERSAAERGVRNIRFRECSGQELPFPPDSFDAVVGRFGIMFFTEPVAGIREGLRVLKTGCRIAHCVWGTREANPFHQVIHEVLDRYVPSPDPEPDAPGAFRFAQPGKLVAVFEEAKATDIHERVLRFNISAPISFDQFFEARTEMSDSLRSKLRKLPPEQRARFKEDVRQNASSYFTPEGFAIPAEVLVVSGSKS